MDDTTLQVMTRSFPDEGLVVAVGGYLDESGGMTLARETRAAPAQHHRHIRIDLAAVCLFNCSGARQLITLVSDLEHLGYDVELVGVRPPLRRALDLTA
ncbi:MAG: STAS domain-containing protein [Acidobacteriota bacterium]|jgi:anti-anti-sigma regulatory factor